jgi:TRAP-type mannitol/chloroaromatic compound transport system permease small subunit
MLARLEKIFDRFSDLMGWIAGTLNLVMLLNVFYDAITRYFFSTGSIALQEMEWHLFAMVLTASHRTGKRSSTSAARYCFWSR